MTTQLQLLMFRAGHDLYSMSVTHIVEIVGAQTVTRIPNAPPFISGVTNVRGRVVPIIDLAVKFGFERTERTSESCIVVVSVPIGGENTILGIMVESVVDMIEFTTADLAAAPSFGMPIDIGFIHGLVPVESALVPLLDVPRILSATELLATRDVAVGESP